MRAAIFSLLSLTLIAHETRMEAPLRRARVYPDQAWLTREASYHFAAAGAQRIRLEGLPADLNLENLRVQVEGIPGLRLGNVAVVPVVGHFEPDAPFQKSTEELKRLEPRIADLRLRQASLEAALKALESLRPQANVETPLSAPLDPLTVADFSRALQARHESLLKQGLLLTAEGKPLESRAALLRETLTRQEEQAQQRSSAVVVELESPQAGQARIVLETRTTQARWKPTYEVRLAEDGKNLELLCYAAVSQASGEEWKHIGLEISNAQPSRNLHVPAAPSSVQVLYEAPGVVTPGGLQGRVTDRSGRPLAGVAVNVRCDAIKVTRVVTTDANGAFRLSLLPAGTYRLTGTKDGHESVVTVTTIENGKTSSLGLIMSHVASALVEVVASSVALDRSEVQKGNNYMLDGVEALPISRFNGNMAQFAPGVVSGSGSGTPEAVLEAAATHFEEAGELGRAWFLEGDRSLPSDAMPRRVLLSRAILPAGLKLLAVPRVSTEVYSLATVNPAAGFPWFQGTPVTVFRGGERLGQVPLPSQQAGEPVAFSFGPVAGLRTQRKRVEAKVVGAKAGKGRQWTLRERVTLVSELDRPVEVEVLEPGLRATSDKVKVELLPEVTPTTRKNSRGDLIWALRVPAREQVKVEEGWRITGPGIGFVPELPALGLPTSD